MEYGKQIWYGAQHLIYFVFLMCISISSVSNCLRSSHFQFNSMPLAISMRFFIIILYFTLRWGHFVSLTLLLAGVAGLLYRSRYQPPCPLPY